MSSIHISDLFQIILVLSLSFNQLPQTWKFTSINNSSTIKNTTQIHQSQIPTFQPSQCMFDVPANIDPSRALECGFVKVPLEHENPDGQFIQLAIVIILSNDPQKQPDPLFMAQGGPGGSTIDAYATPLLTTSKDFVPNRDIILFDQRGTLYSNPKLYCDEIDKLTIDTIDKNLTAEEEQQLSFDALKACRDRLVDQQDIHLSGFDSIENASDIEAIRTALGYEKINLYGVSYGTLLSLHFMRMYPASLRAVILDAIVPPQENFILNSAQTMNASFTRLFETCAQDSACNSQFPDLEKVFFEIIDQLNQEPALISVTDLETGTVYPNAVLDGDAFLSSIFQMLYPGSIIPALPRIIYDAKNGNFDVFSRILALFIFDRTMSLGMYYSVICAEDSDFQPSDQDLSGVRSQIAAVEKDSPKDLLEICNMWQVKPLESTVDDPVISDIPTLLLSGGFDPITPKEYAETVAQTLANSFLVNFPAGGHGQALENPCSNGIIQAFLNNPEQEPDISCVSELSKPEYFTNSNTINFPVALNLLNLEQTSVIQFLFLLISLFILLTAIPVIPLIWLILYFRRKKASATATKTTGFAPVPSDSEQVDQADHHTTITRKSTLLSRSAGWIAFGSGILLLIFMSGIGYVLFDMVMKNDNRLFFGLPASSSGLFLIPLVFLIFSLIMLFAAISSWIHDNWSTGVKIYYSVLSISALVCLIVLSLWGTFTIWL